MMAVSTLDLQSFKEQLLDFVEDREKPFNIEFLIRNCNRAVSDTLIYDVIGQLEEEGQIVRLNHHYLSTRVLMKTWLKPKNQEVPPTDKDFSLPSSMMQQIRELLDKRPDLGYLDIDEFVRDAIRRFIQQIKRKGKG